MPTFVSSVSPKGQVTIPIEIRRRLGIKPKDQVAFQVEADGVRIVPAAFTLESAFGSVKPLQRPRDLEEQIRLAKEEHVEAVRRKLEGE